MRLYIVPRHIHDPIQPLQTPKLGSSLDAFPDTRSQGTLESGRTIKPLPFLLDFADLLGNPAHHVSTRPIVCLSTAPVFICHRAKEIVESTRALHFYFRSCSCSHACRGH